jgi:aspartate-semialdehyde dehydrogenase
MRDEPIIAIGGATGVVGNEMISILNEKRFPCSEVRLLASERSVGEIYNVCGEEVAVEVLDEEAFNDVDIALFSMGAALSEKFAPAAVEAGAYVVDNSSQWRMHDNVPLVVPEVNPESISNDAKIIANPNCSTIQLAPVLKVIHEAAGLKRVVVSTYQATSGAGKLALDELWDQTRAVYSQEEIEIEAFPHQIAFNCIPHIDVFLENGYTKEEYKIINESRKILGLKDLRISCTAVRVPVFHCHAESVNVETEEPLDPEQLNQLLDEASGITVFHSYSDYPMQFSVAGTDDIYVGRVRRDVSIPHGLDLWIVADNIRKGAALNAIQIAELLLEKFA